MSDLTMYDSIYVSNLPGGAAAYAGYVNGNWPTYPTLVTDFPSAYLLSIDVFGSASLAHCLDVESGDATNADVLAWFQRMLGAGVPVPVVYTSADNTQAVINILMGAGYTRQQFLIWSAHYNGVAHICAPSVCGYPAADATQWTDAGPNSCDVSLVADYFFPWTLNGNNPPPPPPKQPMEDDVQIPPMPAGSPVNPVGVSFDGCPYTTVGFCADPGVVGGTSITVRCAFHIQGDSWSVVETTLTPAVTKTVVAVPADCDGVSFTRLDNLNVTLVPNFA